MIQDTCLNGHWTESAYLGPRKNDPPAAPFECPKNPPAEGSACGVCYEECHYDTCTPDGGGGNLLTDCSEGKWLHADVGCLKCCHDDGDCSNGVCVGSRCKALEDAGCYSDAECGTGKICSGAQVCPCGSPCPWVDQGGVCNPDNLGCCGTNDDCPSKQICVQGSCKPPARAGSCWSNLDCVAGLPCAGVNVCPCGALCIVADTPGKCLLPL